MNDSFESDRLLLWLTLLCGQVNEVEAAEISGGGGTTTIATQAGLKTLFKEF